MAGDANGCERLGCPPAGLGSISKQERSSPSRYLDSWRTLIWDGEERQSPYRYLQLVTQKTTFQTYEESSMKKGQNTRGYGRYLAFDIHREYILMGGQNEDQKWVLTPRRVSIVKFPGWGQKNLCQGDIVVLETTTNVWETYDIVAPMHVRELCGFISYRGRLVKTGAMIRNRLQSLLHKHNLMLPGEGILDQAW
jgi:hypothetical protein